MSKESTKKSNILRKKKIIFGILATLLVLVIAALGYFLTTGRKPHGIVPVLGLNKPDYVFSIYGEGKTGKLHNPSGVAIDKKRQVLYVVGRKKVTAFNLDGKPLFSFNKTTKGKRFINPLYIDVDKKGNIYVSDTSQASIFIFNSKGKYVSTFEPKDKNGKRMGWVPLGMAFDKEGNFYVAEKGLHRVLKFSPAGKLLLSFGKLKQVKKIAKDGGYFYFPNDVTVGDDGRIYVSDSNNYRIQIFSKDGKFEKIIAVGGVPRGLALIEKGVSSGIYAANVLDQKITVYSDKGLLKYELGEAGMDNGQFSFPNDIEIYGNRLYIADTENNRVQVWSF